MIQGTPRTPARFSWGWGVTPGSPEVGRCRWPVGQDRRVALRWALFRFAQYAFSRFDMAFLAAALIGARFRFYVVVG